MTNENRLSNLNLVKISIEARWTTEDKEKRRRLAGNKQLQLKELAFLPATVSHIPTIFGFQRNNQCKWLDRYMISREKPLRAMTVIVGPRSSTLRSHACTRSSRFQAVKWLLFGLNGDPLIYDSCSSASLANRAGDGLVVGTRFSLGLPPATFRTIFDLVPASLPFAAPTERTPTCFAVLGRQFRSMLSAQWSSPLNAPFSGGWGAH
jgi:hypothetical protein